MSFGEVKFTIGKTKHYSDGSYQFTDGDSGANGSVYEYYDIVGVQFNQLKAKLFNLVEASTIDEKQREAMKGLIKDFCNNQFKNVVGDLEGWIKRLGFDAIDFVSGVPKSSDPLGGVINR